MKANFYQTYKKLKPGNSILELHGRQKQNKRMAIFFTFHEYLVLTFPVGFRL